MESHFYRYIIASGCGSTEMILKITDDQVTLLYRENWMGMNQPEILEMDGQVIKISKNLGVSYQILKFQLPDQLQKEYGGNKIVYCDLYCFNLPIASNLGNDNGIPYGIYMADEATFSKQISALMTLNSDDIVDDYNYIGKSIPFYNDFIKFMNHMKSIKFGEGNSNNFQKLLEKCRK